MTLFKQQHDNEDFIVLGMLLMISSDADIDEREESGIKTILKSLPRFASLNLDDILFDAKGYIVNNGFEGSIKIFSEIKNENLKKTILVLAIEASMLDHFITDAEEDTIVELSTAMNISEEVLNNAIDVISWKYSLDEI